jgi:hypothetical protein
VICETCGAPAVILKGVCVFCRTPIDESHAPGELLEYLASRLPQAEAKRYGLVLREGVREFDLTLGSHRFRARNVRGRLLLEPDLPPARWIDALLGSLSGAAASDPELRAAFTRSGWALR